jgi:hypothetical protein
MNFKTTYLLFGVLVVMLGVLGVVLYLGPTEAPGTEFAFPIFHDKDKTLSADDITRVVIQRKKPADTDIVFEREGKKDWKIISPRTLPADSPNVTSLVRAIADARIDEENKPRNLKEAGLDSPSRIITLSGKDHELTLTIGDTTLGDENAVVYALSSARPKKPVAVKKRDLASALEDVNYFRGKNLLGEDSADINAILLSRGKTTVEFRREKTNWRMVKPPYGDADVSDLLTAITGLSVSHTSDKDTDFVKDGVTNLAEYNLDPAKKDVLRIAVTRGEGTKAVTTALLVGVSKKVGDSKKGDDKYYAALDEGKAKDVVKVSVSSVEPFIKVLDDPGSKRNKNLVHLENFKTPDAIDVRNTYGTFEFRKADATKSWELYRDKTANSVDESEIRKLIDAINKKDAVTSFPEATPKRKKELGLEKPDAVVTIWADSLEKPDPKKTGKPVFKKGVKPAAELRFGNREGDSVAVERIWGSDSTLVMVPASLFDIVRRGPLAYLDKSLPAFNTGLNAEDNVTRIEVTRPGETIEISREKGTGPWKLVKPASLKGRQASDQVVRDILGELNRLTAKEVVAEKAATGELSKYDLAKPRYKVVVTLTKDKKDTKHEFDFGKEEAGKGVFLKLIGKDPIYLVGTEVLNPLKKELRDTAVLDFNPSDVVAVKFTGWKKTLGSPNSLMLEQKDGKWVLSPKSPLKPEVDTAKVANLLGGLSHLQAEKFVPSGKGLKLAEDAFEVSITLSDKKVLDLTVGAQEGNSYFATSNQLKGDVFLVSKDLFEEARKAPGYFSK